MTVISRHQKPRMFLAVVLSRARFKVYTLPLSALDLRAWQETPPTGNTRETHERYTRETRERHERHTRGYTLVAGLPTPNKAWRQRTWWTRIALFFHLTHAVTTTRHAPTIQEGRDVGGDLRGASTHKPTHKATRTRQSGWHDGDPIPPSEPRRTDAPLSPVDNQRLTAPHRNPPLCVVRIDVYQCPGRGNID